jgi:hypothetical protein
MGLSLSDFDPTSKNAKYGRITGAALGGPLGYFAPDLLGRTSIDQSGLEAERRLAEQARGEYEGWQRRWNDLSSPTGRTAQRRDELYGIYGGEVDKGMYDAGTRSASTFRGRGMGDSGYASAGQSSVIQAAASDRVKARERSWQDALSEGQSLLAGELPAMSAKYGAMFKPYGDAATMAMIQAQMDERRRSDMLGGLTSLGSLAFMGGGGPKK